MILKLMPGTMKTAVLIGMLCMFFSQTVLSEQQQQFKELDTLLNLFNIPHEFEFNSMVDATQTWRRTPGQERWQLPDIKTDSATRDQAIALIREMGLMDEASPASKEYDYVLLLGATVPRMQRRLEHVVKLWQEGIRYKRLVFLVSQRPLDTEIDQVNQLIGNTSGHLAKPQSRPITETEGAIMLFQFTPMMPEMRSIPVTFVDSPRHWNQTYWQRPNTRDTLKSWMAKNPAPGKTLVISDQPNGRYQEEVVRQELPETFFVDLAAPAADSETRLAIYLDALALWMHNLQKRVGHCQPVPGKPDAKMPLQPTWH